MKRLVMFMALLAIAGMVFYACGSSSSGGFIPGTKTTSTLYFQANDGYLGGELYKTNGMASGTALVNDINVSDTGTPSMDPSGSNPRDFTEAGGVFYFRADPGTGAFIAYKVNKDGEAEALSTEAGVESPVPADSLVEAGDDLYIVASSNLSTVGSSGVVNAVYEANGTVQVTLAGNILDDGKTVYLVNGAGNLSRVGDNGLVFPVFEDDGKTPVATLIGRLMYEVGGTVFFYNSGGSMGTLGSDGMAHALYRSDGTTQAVDLFPVGAGDTAYMIDMAGSLALNFVNSSGHVAHVYDNGDTQVALKTPFIADVDGSLYFNDFERGLSFINSAGKAETVMGPGGTAVLDSNNIGFMRSAGKRLVFQYTTAESGTEPYIINSSGSAEMLMEINLCSDKADSSMSIFSFIYDEVSGVLYFEADDCVHGSELWRTEGTASTTKMVKDINVRTHNGATSGTIAEFGDIVLYSADGGNMTGSELYGSDGTEANTALIKDLNAGSDNSSPSNYTVSGTNAFFQAWDDVNYILTMTDGTTAGTGFVNDEDGNLVFMSSIVSAEKLAANNTLYFINGSGGLYHVDSAAMTAKEIDTSALGGVQDLRLVGGTVYLINTGGNGTLHALDTSADPVLDTAITNVDGVGIVKPIDVTSAGAAVIFVAADTGLNGYTLYEIESGVAQEIREATTLNLLEANTDIIYNTSGTSKLYYGTAAQLFEVDLEANEATEIAVVGVDADSFMEASDGAVYFTDNAGANLYFIDDTTATGITTTGTVTEMLEVGGVVYVVDNGVLRYVDANATLVDIGLTTVVKLMDVGGTLYLLDGSWWGGDLYYVSGTTAIAVTDGTADITGADWYRYTEDKLFLSYQDDPANGWELWVVDPATDPAAATMIELNDDPNINWGSSDPDKLFVGGTELVFRAFTPAYGDELWISDGTVAGTRMVKDINADTMNSLD